MGRPKITLKEYIISCHLKHNFFYDYTQTDLIKIKSNIIIICPFHGEFVQDAYYHRNGGGCPECSGNAKLTYDKFIERSNVIHNNKYIYEYCEKISHSTTIKIFCPCENHGMFYQTVNSHLDGKGCKKCANVVIGNKRKKSKEKVINKCNFIHNNKYDYSKLDYEYMNDIVEIGCPNHGYYFQRLSDHQAGKGCSLCNNKISKAVQDISHILTINKIKYITEYKFDDCKNINPLPFDFYLPDYNICIEYDGEQHYVEKEHWGGVDELINIKKRDLIKTNFCNINNINLIRINYKQNHRTILENLIGDIKNAI
ncbi:TPA: hypothetical protein OGU99_000801 [Escherichia coli]|nr:hypothetical protein [Escherichia coli]HCQ0858868.1 hypothetical protein [Escherichia coli]